MKCFDSHLDNDYSNGKSTHETLRSTINLIKQEIMNIERFELRMAVIAPMKAGKSTIINALIGENILPTRATSMTTLPTEVVFNREIEQPILILTKDVINFNRGFTKANPRLFKVD